MKCQSLFSGKYKINILFYVVCLKVYPEYQALRGISTLSGERTLSKSLVSLLKKGLKGKNFIPEGANSSLLE